MFHPRNLLIFVGALLLLFGGVTAWRSAHPPLSDEQQIVANVEALRTAIEGRNTKRIQGFLAEDFSWNGQNKRELNAQLTGGMLRWRDVTANVTGLQTSINGDSATSSGKFSLAFRPTPRGRSEAYLGDFKIFWKKQNGEWLISKVEGGEKVEN